MRMRLAAAAVPLLLLISPAFAAGDDLAELRTELEQTKALVQKLREQFGSLGL